MLKEKPNDDAFTFIFDFEFINNALFIDSHRYIYTQHGLP